jgi:hypothetical protein
MIDGIPNNDGVYYASSAGSEFPVNIEIGYVF